MTVVPAGTEVDYTVTYLEMDARPAYSYPHMPATHAASLIRAESPPTWYFLALYDAVGIRIHDMPITAEKVLAALRAREGDGSA